MGECTNCSQRTNPEEIHLPDLEKRGVCRIIGRNGIVRESESLELGTQTHESP